MTRGAGLLRTDDSLAEAQRVAGEIASNAPAPLQAAAVAAGLICRSARSRDESRGVHFRTDAPSRRSEWEGKHVTLVGE
jgi:aspartate oxidase